MEAIGYAILIIISLFILAVFYLISSEIIKDVIENFQNFIGGIVMIIMLVGSFALGIHVGGFIGGIIIIIGIILMYVVGNSIMKD